MIINSLRRTIIKRSRYHFRRQQLRMEKMQMDLKLRKLASVCVFCFKVRR